MLACKLCLKPCASKSVAMHQVVRTSLLRQYRCLHANSSGRLLYAWMNKLRFSPLNMQCVQTLWAPLQVTVRPLLGKVASQVIGSSMIAGPRPPHTTSASQNRMGAAAIPPVSMAKQPSKGLAHDKMRPGGHKSQKVRIDSPDEDDDIPFSQVQSQLMSRPMGPSPEGSTVDRADVQTASLSKKRAKQAIAPTESAAEDDISSRSIAGGQVFTDEDDLPLARLAGPAAKGSTPENLAGRPDSKHALQPRDQLEASTAKEAQRVETWVQKPSSPARRLSSGHKSDDHRGRQLIPDIPGSGQLHTADMEPRDCAAVGGNMLESVPLVEDAAKPRQGSPPLDAQDPVANAFSNDHGDQHASSGVNAARLAEAPGFCSFQGDTADEIQSASQVEEVVPQEGLEGDTDANVGYAFAKAAVASLSKESDALSNRSCSDRTAAKKQIAQPEAHQASDQPVRAGSELRGSVSAGAAAQRPKRQRKSKLPWWQVTSSDAGPAGVQSEPDTECCQGGKDDDLDEETSADDAPAGMLAGTIAADELSTEDPNPDAAADDLVTGLPIRAACPVVQAHQAADSLPASGTLQDAVFAECPQLLDDEASCPDAAESIDLDNGHEAGAVADADEAPTLLADKTPLDELPVHDSPQPSIIERQASAPSVANQSVRACPADLCAHDAPGLPDILNLLGSPSRQLSSDLLVKASHHQGADGPIAHEATICSDAPSEQAHGGLPNIRAAPDASPNELLTRPACKAHQAGMGESGSASAGLGNALSTAAAAAAADLLTSSLPVSLPAADSCFPRPEDSQPSASATHAGVTTQPAALSAKLPPSPDGFAGPTVSLPVPDIPWPGLEEAQRHASAAEATRATATLVILSLSALDLADGTQGASVSLSAADSCHPGHEDSQLKDSHVKAPSSGTPGFWPSSHQHAVLAVSSLPGPEELHMCATSAEASPALVLRGTACASEQEPSAIGPQDAPGSLLAPASSPGPAKPSASAAEAAVTACQSDPAAAESLIPDRAEKPYVSLPATDIFAPRPKGSQSHAAEAACAVVNTSDGCAEEPSPDKPDVPSVCLRTPEISLPAPTEHQLPVSSPEAAVTACHSHPASAASLMPDDLTEPHVSVRFTSPLLVPRMLSLLPLQPSCPPPPASLILCLPPPLQGRPSTPLPHPLAS